MNEAEPEVSYNIDEKNIEIKKSEFYSLSIST